MNSNFYINNASSEPNEKTIEYFTIIGKHKFIDKDDNPRIENDEHACAKKVVSQKSIKYFVKTGVHGKLYNPIGMFSEGTINKSLSRAGKKMWEFDQVNSKVFDMYLMFLKTKNKAWLVNAEREMN